MRREIDFDEETDQTLELLAQDYQGDLGKALAELLHAHQHIEGLAEESERAHRDVLLVQMEHSEHDFQQGRTVTWDEIKRRNGL